MLDIFIVENHIVRPSVDILMVYPFDEIWERDKSKNKGEAIRDFTYIHFYTSPLSSNPYKDYDPETRHERIISGSLDEDYSPDRLVLEAIEVYTEKFLQDASFSYNFVMAAFEGARKIQAYFRTVDLDERDKNGRPIHKATDVTRALADTENVLRNLQILQLKMYDELVQQKGTTKDRIINHYEK